MHVSLEIGLSPFWMTGAPRVLCAILVNLTRRCNCHPLVQKQPSLFTELLQALTIKIMCVCQTKDRMLYQLRSKVELSKSPTYSNNHSVWLFHATGFSHFWSCSNMLHRVTFSIHSTVACLTPATKFIICYKWFLSPRRVSL